MACSSSLSQILSPEAVHDPSRIIKDENTYWLFCTGTGILAYHTNNINSWENFATSVFKDEPEWCLGYTGEYNIMWAPSIVFMNSSYYLYYAVSSFGSSKSAIGLAKTVSLNNPNWEDKGEVLSSNGSFNTINAIDPALVKDNDKVWMVYGSWFGGIGIVEIDSITGKTVGAVHKLYGGQHQDIEAPYIFKRNGYYYLVVNRGECCQGINSTYYLTVGRSRNILGPYEGKDSLNKSNFCLLLKSESKYIGPGHFGLFSSGGSNDIVSVHYYQGNTSTGWPSKLMLYKMSFEEDWPVLHPLESSTSVQKKEEANTKLCTKSLANGMLQICFSVDRTNLNCKVEVFDISGICIHSIIGISESQFITDIKSGVYIVTLTTTHRKESVKIFHNF